MTRIYPRLNDGKSRFVVVKGDSCAARNHDADLLCNPTFASSYNIFTFYLIHKGLGFRGGESPTVLVEVFSRKPPCVSLRIHRAVYPQHQAMCRLEKRAAV